jgi:hypothetical protein
MIREGIQTWTGDGHTELETGECAEERRQDWTGVQKAGLEAELETGDRAGDRRQALKKGDGSGDREKCWRRAW